MAKITHLVFSSEVSGLQAWKWAEKSRCKWVVTPLKWCHSDSADELLHFEAFVNLRCKSSRIGSVVFWQHWNNTSVCSSDWRGSVVFKIVGVFSLSRKCWFRLYVESLEWSWTAMGEGCSGLNIPWIQLWGSSGQSQRTLLLNRVYFHISRDIYTSYSAWVSQNRIIRESLLLNFQVQTHCFWGKAKQCSNLDCSWLLESVNIYSWL